MKTMHSMLVSAALAAALATASGTPGAQTLLCGE